MNSIAFQTLFIALVIGVTCALLGVFLFLRKMVMISDAISHTVLLGIVITFMLVNDLTSWWIVVGASIAGVMTVVYIEGLIKTKFLKEDSAIATVYSFLFSVAIIIISTRFRHTHLDSHALFGNLEFAAFQQITFFGVSISSTLFISTVILIGILLLGNLVFTSLSISTFDAVFATSVGISLSLLHYGLMSMVSLTIVNSFQSLGVILVITFIIAPAASASLWVKSMKGMLIASAMIAVLNVLGGYFIAMNVLQGRVNLAASMSTLSFITFLNAWFFSPSQGLISSILRRKNLQYCVYQIMLLEWIIEAEEKSVLLENIETIGIKVTQAKKILKIMKRKNFIVSNEKGFILTLNGRMHYTKLKEQLTS